MARNLVPRFTVECAREGCTNTREVTQNQIDRNKSGRFFCSAECRNITGVKPRTLPDLTCETCGVTYRTHQARQNASSRWCSRECKSEGLTKPRIQVGCEHCGDIFTTYAKDDGQLVRRFCSHKCATDHRVTRGVGRIVNGRAVTEHVSGYLQVYVPGRGRVMEHRYVMEQELGRDLLPDEQVHHINHIKTDNRPANLALLSPRAHAQETRQATYMRAEAKAARIRELEAELLELRQSLKEGP